MEKIKPFFGLITAIIALITGFLVFRQLRPENASGFDWQTLAALGVGVCIAFLVVLLLRTALSSQAFGAANGPNPATPAVVDPDVWVRTRVAPLVLAIGSIAIAVFGLGLVVVLSVLVTKGDAALIAALTPKIDTLLMGVFTAVLPVFATWVGTVLAFYFSNESFRQAAKAAQDARGAIEEAEKLTERMIPYAGIVKIEVKRADARGVLVDAIVGKFSAAVTRLPIFDELKQPIFIIRKDMLTSWLDPNGVLLPAHAGKTLDAFLKDGNGENGTKAVKFGFVAVDSTVEKARLDLINSKSSDLFVTQSGQRSEPVLGWLPDDKLK